MFQRSFVVGSCGITRIVKASEMVPMPGDIYVGLVLSPVMSPSHTLEAGGVVSRARPVCLILRHRCNAKIAPLIVQSVPITMVHFLASNAPPAPLSNQTVHCNSWPPARCICCLPSAGIACVATSLELPLPLHEVLIVAVVNYRLPALCQRNHLHFNRLGLRKTPPERKHRAKRLGLQRATLAVAQRPTQA